jgi:hypothetical protein
MIGFDAVWERIVALEGETFRQKTGRPFRYRISGASLVPSTTNRLLPRSQFARAFDRAPLRGPGQLQDLQGPSYLFAILTDPRVSGAGPDAASTAGIPEGSGLDGDDSPVQAAASGGHVMPAVPADPAVRPVMMPAASWLMNADPRRVLLVIACSAAKARGGQPASGGPEPGDWPEALHVARAQVLARADGDASRLLPAWQRYEGTFYRHAGPALAEAAATGNVVILSGGYGVARADELIGWYDTVLRLADWPAGLLESALISQAGRAGADTVVAFASRTTAYAQLLRRARWRDAGLRASLVTISDVAAGAMAEVPRRLGLAFAAFWDQRHGAYPPGTVVEQLS